jgi:methionyl-tRNA formyltransferase
MTTFKTLKIGFVSSSDFCIPIGDALLKLQGKSFNQLIDEHIIGLNKAKYTIGENKFEVIDPTDYQDVKTMLSEINNWPIEFQLVISQPDNINRNKSTPSPISQWALDNNIQLWKPENINAEENVLFGDLDLIITASFGQLISQKLLDKPKYGFINWHPSLLPKYRGPTPMQSTILNQEKQYGLSWITMTKAMDAGKVLLQLENELDPSLDFETMANQLGKLGAETLAIALLNQILDIGTEQDQSRVLFCKKIEKEQQLIKINELTASQIMAQQKAFIRFPGTVFEDKYFESKVRIMDCQVLDENLIKGIEVVEYKNWKVGKVDKKQIVFIECSNQSLLQIHKIKLGTGKLVDLSGYQFR